MDKDNQRRLALVVGGRVQGVGFRPYVWRLARQARLGGLVSNTAAGVRIEIQGSPQAVEWFRNNFKNKLPPLARIESMNLEELPPLQECGDFSIEKSGSSGSQGILVSPDIGICAQCLADIRDPANRRGGYPFTNCTDCGPRFSITSSLPYDRSGTCMACFELCPDCAREYADPADRRFHAQPVACGMCGPRLWYVDKAHKEAGNSLPENSETMLAIASSAKLLCNGGILALKGLGGFQLACDARNEDAVRKLRQRKARPHKALAVMARDVQGASLFCSPTDADKALMESPARPVALCPAGNAPMPLVSAIAPDTDYIGVMLPNTPLHALLLDEVERQSGIEPALVMTSANAPGEPICLGNREALASLEGMADAWLLHDRDILVRVDDSVVAADRNGAQDQILHVRRARGYVPEPVPMPALPDAPPVLGAGAELKTTFCLTRGNLAFPGQHIGDLKSPAVMDFYRQALAHMINLLDVAPQAIVHDLHPDYLSTIFASEFAQKAGIPCFSLQHHAAHAAACLAENEYTGPALALCLDGTGFGTDGSIWGGELLYMDLARAQWRRLGSLAPFALPGGEAAIRQPWRICQSLLWGSGEKMSLPVPAIAETAVAELLERDLNCPLTSSCGRLFDAVAALAGLCAETSYEGQAPMRLETAARQWLCANPDKRPAILWKPRIKHCGDLELLDSRDLFACLARVLHGGMPAPAIAAAFHFDLARAYAELAARQAARLGIRKIALGGGVMQNRLFKGILEESLRQKGLLPLVHHHLPPGDGCISCGQAAWGRQLLAQKDCQK